MSIDNLKQLYFEQLHDLHSANQQSADVTKQLSEAATNKDLSDALKRGAEGIHDGISVITEITSKHDDKGDSTHCRGMEGLVEEAKAHALNTSFGDDDIRDAMIITQYQQMAHYAIAGYGCLATFALRLGFNEDYKKIKNCLDACYDGDRTLSKLAESEINANAA